MSTRGRVRSPENRDSVTFKESFAVFPVPNPGRENPARGTRCRDTALNRGN
jgi:predicted RNA-binding Zn-ribbon protein involved in translation (DUF1610 family)